MGRHRIEIEFDTYDGGSTHAAEDFFNRIDEAISHFDWHVTRLEIGMTPIVKDPT
jgi:hypothetical protein